MTARVEDLVMDFSPLRRFHTVPKNVSENVGFIPTAINIELVLVTNEGVVRSFHGHSVLVFLGCPLLSISIELSQIIEVGSSLARVSSKEEYARLVVQAVGA